ncbi:uncharacterized protein [Palaemon carinicauda]|uniref:uncharacterized protein n=1 Tax=Palaemon carinicauda TaxID=392227 RepID=UPI0035B626A9
MLWKSVATDYSKVEALILKAYDLVPEAYRLKFRNFMKPNTMSYVEYAHHEEEYLVIDSKVVRVNFLRDTGSARSLVLSRVLKDVGENSENYVVLGGFPDTVVSAPLVEVEVLFPGYHKVTELAVVEKLPIPGINGILGNYMLDAQGYEICPIVSVTASPVAITTRASAKAAATLQNEDNLNFSSLEVDVERLGSVGSGSSRFINKIFNPDCDRVSFIEAQKAEFNYEIGVGRLDPLAIVYEPVSLVLDHTLEEQADLFCQVSSDALTSPWSSPIVLVKKPDGQFHTCVDYRKVNANTKNDSFPLPRIEDCLDRIGPAKFITKLDL